MNTQTTARGTGLNSRPSNITAAGSPQTMASVKWLPAQSLLLAIVGSSAAGSLILDRRTRHVAVCAEHATITAPWSQHLTAALARVKSDACVCWHGFQRLMPARGASDGRMQLKHRAPLRAA